MTPARPLELAEGTVLLDGDVVVDEVDFHVDPGEFVVLLGANGSGKTTLIRALLGLVPLESGEVCLFGVPLRSFHEWRRIGYVPQRVTAATGVPATVEEVVLSGRVARAPRWGGYRTADRVAAGEAIAAVGLEGMERQSVERLSGGQQQRVLIARAVVAEPDVLLLDEPVSGVDVEHQQGFATMLTTLRERGTSVLLVAHALGRMEPLVGRAMVLDQGRIAYDGPPLVEQITAGHVHHHPAQDMPDRGLPGIARG